MKFQLRGASAKDAFEALEAFEEIEVTSTLRYYRCDERGDGRQQSLLCARERFTEGLESFTLRIYSANYKYTVSENPQ